MRSIPRLTAQRRQDGPPGFPVALVANGEIHAWLKRQDEAEAMAVVFFELARLTEQVAHLVAENDKNLAELDRARRAISALATELTRFKAVRTARRGGRARRRA